MERGGDGVGVEYGPLPGLKGGREWCMGRIVVYGGAVGRVVRWEWSGTTGSMYGGLGNSLSVWGRI